MKERINEIWHYLLNANSRTHGYVKSLVSSSIALPIYLAILFPKKSRALLIDIPNPKTDLIRPFEGRGLKMDIISPDRDNSKYQVLLQITTSEFSQVFDVLIEDCLNAISTIEDKDQGFNIFIDRLTIWRKLFETYSEEGLSFNALQGLYGELFILLRLIRKFPNRVLELLSAWQGPYKHFHDFHYDKWAIEVKTSISNDEAKIANASQLSLSGLDNLFLWHLSLHRSKINGSTINNLIQEIGELISNTPNADSIFNSKLAANGFYNHQSILYERDRFIINQIKLFSIVDGFPALTNANLPKGIREIQYTIDLLACNSFLINENLIYSTLKL